MSRNAADVTLPPLETGDHFTVAEFERRYALHPEIKKAELVEGVVYVSSPVRFLATTGGYGRSGTLDQVFQRSVAVVWHSSSAR